MRKPKFEMKLDERIELLQRFRLTNEKIWKLDSNQLFHGYIIRGDTDRVTLGVKDFVCIYQYRKRNLDVIGEDRRNLYITPTGRFYIILENKRIYFIEQGEELL